MHPRMFARVLVPHDFSEAADRVLATAAELATSEDGTVTVIHVITPLSPVRSLAYTAPQTLDPAALQGQVAEKLESRVASVLGAAGARCEVAIGNPGQRIAAAAADATVIVMPTHARTGVSHALMGSVAQRVLQLSPVPVLVVPPQRDAAARRAAPVRRAPRR
jgi:nucleotide-binding universal stress UspA family protein